jgi:hypothetical protein
MHGFILESGVRSGDRSVGAMTVNAFTTAVTFFFFDNPLSSAFASKTGTRRYSVTRLGGIGPDPLNLGLGLTQTAAPTAAPFTFD